MTTEAQDLINMRLDQADESLTEARLLVERGMRLGAMDRIYFTMFYCACRREARKTAHQMGFVRMEGLSIPTDFVTITKD